VCQEHCEAFILVERIRANPDEKAHASIDDADLRMISLLKDEAPIQKDTLATPHRFAAWTAMDILHDFEGRRPYCHHDRGPKLSTL